MLAWAPRHVVKMTIKNDQWVVTDKLGTLTYSMRTDPTKNPKVLDKTYAWPGQSGTLLGIYKLEGDELTVCWATEGTTRPTEFESTNDWVLAKYKRMAK